MKKIYAIGLSLLSIMVSAQQKSEKKDKAKELLEQVYNQVKGYKNMYIVFRYAIDNPKENVKQDTQGTIILQGDKYFLNYLGAEKLFDGQKIYTIIPDNEEVTIEKSEDKEGNITPSQMLTFYKKDYSYKWDIQQNVKGKKIQYVELRPLKNSANTKQILLGIDVKSKQIYNVIEVGKNNTRTTITITEFKVNQNLPAQQFVFNEAKYKKMGYHISKY